MAWTEFTRKRYDRNAARYSSDVTDEEWAIVAPLLPGPNLLGRPRTTDLRAVWDAIQYVAATGCAWSLLPKDFPAVSTVRYYFYCWRDDGLLAEINRALVALAREMEGRNSQPTAGVIDSQSVKTTENTSLSGYDAGKRIKGRKRHILTGIGRWTIQIVKRSDAAQGFEVLPRRWVVERTFAWLGKCRRLARDWEKTIESAQAWVLIAHIRRMARRLARA